MLCPPARRLIPARRAGSTVEFRGGFATEGVGGAHGGGPRHHRCMKDLTDRQRVTLRKHVELERERVAARAAALQRDLDDMVIASADAVHDDEHDPEGATIAYERAQAASLLADARAQLTDLERAAQRLDQPGAGRCAVCKEPIGYERLLARPGATTCVSCAANRAR